MPPTLGLVGKFYLFRTAIQGGFIGLAIIGVLTSLISAYYYLRVVVTMYMREGEPELIANLTTDAWFGDSTEPWIHLALAKLRAVEKLLPCAHFDVFAEQCAIDDRIHQIGLEIVDVLQPDVEPQRRSTRSPFGRGAVRRAVEGDDETFEATP